MSKKSKPEEPFKVEFAPGCFDQFDGTQEELDALMGEIHSMFANMSREELEAKSKPVNFDELSDEELQILSSALDDGNPNHRKLQ